MAAPPPGTLISPASSPAAHPGGGDGSRPLVEFILARRFAGHREFEHTSHAFGGSSAGAPGGTGGDGMVDFLFLAEQDPHDPAEVFERVRWGGQVVYISRHRREVEAAAAALAGWHAGEADRGAWLIEQPLGCEHKYLFNWRMLGWRTPVYYLVARKMALVPPGKSSDRFTYNVYLEKDEHGHCVVVKEVPTAERVLGRLKEKFPEADEETLRRRARKFTDKIFPVFLTRETAILKLLERDLPRKFRGKVPRVMAADVDAQGYTRKLRLKWLRNGRKPVEGSDRGRPLTQLEFAHQAAELLASLHDDARVMHLDLRLDNFVITDHGVGFVDFGSAVRVGEEFPEASLLCNLFDEMMRTSQIQRMLGKMSEAGQVTSEEIRNSYGRIDKAVDFFYLAVQINAPLSNPDFRGLVEYDPESAEARELAALTAEILRPSDTSRARFTSAQDILRGIEEIERKLGRARV